MNFIYVFAGIGLVPAIVACFIKDKNIKALFSALSLLGVLLCSYRFSIVLRGFVAAHGVWLSFSLCGTAFIASMLFVWKPFTPKARRTIALSIAGALVLATAAIAGPDIYGKYFMPQLPGEELDLSQYMPFGNRSGGKDPHFTLVRTLGTESTLKLNDDLPRLDGATALYPLYSAFVRAVYPEGEYRPYEDLYGKNAGPAPIVVCSKTSTAFENLIDGYADVVFLMGVSGEQKAMAEARGLTLTLTPIGHEAFVFFVNNRNSVANLSTDDIRRIYSGEVTNWSDVGGGNDKIRAYQRPDESGSQTMLKQIIGNAALAPAPKDDIYQTMLGMYKRVAGYRNYKNSLGYSFLFYVRDMVNENKVKFLSIDGVAPTRENIASGAYPFAHDFYAVTAKRNAAYMNAERTENINQFIDWILSPQGQFLVAATGYVPLP
jgi:phosphate transport system substrate-binding protein